MNRRNAKMKCVLNGFRWQTASIHDETRQVFRRFRQVQHREPRNHFKAALNGIRVTLRDFLDDYLGDEYFKIVPPLSPPLVRDLLACGLDQIPAWQRGQIAYYAAFKVQMLHPAPLQLRFILADEDLSNHVDRFGSVWPSHARYSDSSTCGKCRRTQSSVIS